MPEEGFEIEIDMSDIENWSEEMRKKGDEGVSKVAQKAYRETIKEMPKDTHNLANMTGLQKIEDMEYGIGSNVFYRWYVHDGTGIYGERGVPITPVYAQFLKFEYDGRLIITRSVKGQEPNPFYERAVETTEKSIDSIMNDVLGDL